MASLRLDIWDYRGRLIALSFIASSFPVASKSSICIYFVIWHTSIGGQIGNGFVLRVYRVATNTWPYGIISELDVAQYFQISKVTHSLLQMSTTPS